MEYDAAIDRIASAVLYEGHLLYPYRPSIKNTRRSPFGSIYPRDSNRVAAGTERWRLRAECLVTGDANAQLKCQVRFLQFIDRRVARFRTGLSANGDSQHGLEPACSNPDYEWVASLEVEGVRHSSWQETEERRLDIEVCSLDLLLESPRRIDFSFAAAVSRQMLETARGRVAAMIVRRQAPLEGAVQLTGRQVADDGFVVAIDILNESPVEAAPSRNQTVETPRLGPADQTSDEGLLQAFASTHAIMQVDGGQFTSMIDPPEAYGACAPEMGRGGLWPVLVGDPRLRNALLCSPIILYDYPEIAPESPGDFFDATEIDELLNLRIMTLTDDEKRQMSTVDGRGQELLARTQALAQAEIANLHGAVRSMRRIEEPEYGK